MKLKIFIVFAILIVVVVFVRNSQVKRIQAESEELGDVSLRPDMTFGQLKTAIPLPTTFEMGKAHNECVVSFGKARVDGHSLVEASFFEPYSDRGCESVIRESALAFEIDVREPFKGSLAGMYIGTPEPQRVRVLQRSFPGARKKGVGERYQLNDRWDFVSDDPGQSLYIHGNWIVPCYPGQQC